MYAIGRQVPSYHQLGFAHGIQCAVLDAIYKKNQDDQEEEDESVGNKEEANEDTDSNSDSEGGEFVVEQHLNRGRDLYLYRDVHLKM
ncbi:unnamed protein product [Parnassius apollo]|uniref:(apollo) hypothetical protein n=1 Tax=Parnassius apollo TaxID=110799 RepID=A0A8S3XVV0_PARAO|nr:unnamed protein product [Parnassius apollo]